MEKDKKQQMQCKSLNICQYSPTCDLQGVNARLNLLFKEVCALKTNGSGGGGSNPVSITEDDFESDGTTYLNNKIGSKALSIFWNDINRFIYRRDNEWQYVTGGIQITIPGFDANSNLYNLEIWIKG